MHGQLIHWHMHEGGEVHSGFGDKKALEAALEASTELDSEDEDLELQHAAEGSLMVKHGLCLRHESTAML